MNLATKLFINFLIITLGINLISAQKVYYKMPNGKIIDEKMYEEVKTNLSTKGTVEENFISEEIRQDSVIKTTKLVIYVGDVMKSPYAAFEKMIGDIFPIDNFPNVVNGEKNSTYIKGKPAFLNFWFIGCLPCMEEIPVLEKLFQTYSAKVNFIGITFSDKTKVATFVNAKNVNIPQITNAQIALDKMKIDAYPMNILLDKEGMIIGVFGELTDFNVSQLESIMNDALK